MSIKRRITRIVKANRNAAAETQQDPRIEAQNAQAAQRSLLDQARRGAADVAAHHHRVGLAANDAAAYLNRVEAAVAAAVQRGDDDAARAAIRESMTARRRLDTLTAQLREAEQQARRLHDDVQRLEQRVRQNAMEYDAMLARRAAAQAAIGVHEALASSSREAASIEAARRSAELEVRRFEAQAQAREELSWSDPSSPRLQQAFEELEAEAAAQQQLDEIKRRGLRGNPSQRS
ncbi:PspA/IM30 family protein [Arthrobacter agilis]|uniref:PspA/IM30 family protein n=1 Tax=Arthrobacter agilis TaxID=37921 RepID=UPI002366F9F3|nr:PspA/IM30 family protein [Arthrobacter agilis]WDF32948.1 PspA/IM30 family protein [Arthrobacter agilis]